MRARRVARSRPGTAISSGSAMLSPTGMRGSSEPNGSWNTIWISARRGRISRSDRSESGWPRNRTAPRTRRFQRHQQPRQRGFAGAGFADNAQGPPLLKTEGDPGHRLDMTAAFKQPLPGQRIGLMEIARFEQGNHAGSGSATFGSGSATWQAMVVRPDLSGGRVSAQRGSPRSQRP